MNPHFYIRTHAPRPMARYHAPLNRLVHVAAGAWLFLIAGLFALALLGG